MLKALLLNVVALTFATATYAGERWTCPAGSTGSASEVVVDANKLIFADGMQARDILENTHDHILGYTFVPSNKKGTALGIGTTTYTLFEKSSGRMIEFNDFPLLIARSWGSNAPPRARVVNKNCTKME